MAPSVPVQPFEVCQFDPPPAALSAMFGGGESRLPTRDRRGISARNRGAPVSAIGVGERLVYERLREPTSASTWYAVSGSPITDELLEWPPDLFALANVVLARAEAFRFALSPVEAWPPSRHHDWAHAVEEAGRRLSIRVEDRTAAMPDLVLEEWSGVVGERLGDEHSGIVDQGVDPDR
jgi:hypothetical protein